METTRVGHTAAALATHIGFDLGPVLIGGLVVVYGASITSLGQPWPPGRAGWAGPSA